MFLLFPIGFVETAKKKIKTSIQKKKYFFSFKTSRQEKK